MSCELVRSLYFEDGYLRTHLQRLDEVQVVVGDVVVVVLNLRECTLVLLQQLVDVGVLALLDLVDLRRGPDPGAGGGERGGGV
jgi:hypothetical protein